MKKTPCPHWINETEWNTHYERECAAIREYGWHTRRDQFNKNFPAPYRGPINAEAARYAALCDLMQ